MNTETTVTKDVEQHGDGAERTRGYYFRPLVDIVEKADELLLMAEMPGVKSDEIDINFEDGELRVYGPVKPRQTEVNRWLLREYGVGDFFRTFRVSEQVDPTRVSAEYRNGLLTVHLPKVEAARPRKIAVSAC